MDFSLLLENLRNPALLFFLLGIVTVTVKSDLSIPENSSKFISLYLLFAIGFKGGQELSHSNLGPEILFAILFGIVISCIIALYSFFLLKRRLSVENAGAIAAAYGSVSAVTFVTGVSFLELNNMSFGGHMVAVMAMMEAPAIVVGVILMRIYANGNEQQGSLRSVVHHSFTNGSVLLILGSLVIGFLSSAEQAEGIKPFTTDLFKGFLAIFLLDMGITSGRKLKDFIKSGWLTTGFAAIIPLLNGCAVALLSSAVTTDPGNRFMFAVLAASASYIAVPAAMKIAAPKANPGLFLPMALTVTFPINITIGMPLYLLLIRNFG